MADVFVGFLFDDAKEKELLSTSKKGVSTAPNQYQKGFLSGLYTKMQILSAISTGSFPRLNTRLVFRREKKCIPEGNITYLPFLNFYLIRDWMFEKGIYRELVQTIERQERTTVYVYSLHLPFLNAIIFPKLSTFMSSANGEISCRISSRTWISSPEIP